MKKRKNAIILPTKEITQKKHISSVAHKQGFFTIYGLIIMQLILSFVSMLSFRVYANARFLKSDNTLECAELYAIHKAKNDLLNYEEQDEDIHYLGFDIYFEYDDITCYISIEKEGERYIESCLQWDDIDNVVIDYTYVS